MTYDIYVIFVILLTPEPFLADTKNTPIPDVLIPNTQKSSDFYTNSKYFEARLDCLTPAPHNVVHVINIRYDLASARVHHYNMNVG